MIRGENHSCTICYLPAWELVLCLLKCLSLALRLFNSIALNPCSALRLRAPEALGSILHKHYDAFPHEISGNASLCHLLAGNFRVKFLQDYRWNCYSLTTGCLQFLLVPNLQNLLGSNCFGKSCQQLVNHACYGLHGWCRTFYNTCSLILCSSKLKMQPNPILLCDHRTLNAKCSLLPQSKPRHAVELSSVFLKWNLLPLKMVVSPAESGAAIWRWLYSPTWYLLLMDLAGSAPQVWVSWGCSESSSNFIHERVARLIFDDIPQKTYYFGELAPANHKSKIVIGFPEKPSLFLVGGWQQPTPITICWKL